MTKKGGQVKDLWWKEMVRKLPLTKNSLDRVHELYEKNWWHLTRSYRTKEGKKFQRRERWLTVKENLIREKLGLNSETPVDCHLGSYDRFLLSRLVECYTSRKNNKKHLTEVDSCDILSEFEGEV